MPRKPRLEIEGALSHVITRGNDRQEIFHWAEDHAKFLSLPTIQEEDPGSRLRFCDSASVSFFDQFLRIVQFGVY